MRWILACVVCVLVALIWEQHYGAGRPAAAAPEHAIESAPPGGDPGARLEAASSPERVAQEPADTPPLEAEAAPDLLELLRRVALAYAEQDSDGLGSALHQLLAKPEHCEEALLLLEHGGLQQDELASRGAVLALGSAVSIYNSPGRTLAVDAHAFTEHVLEGLAEVLPPEQQDLAQQLIEAKSGEHYVLDLTFLAKILELRRQHPDLAELYSSLLVHMAENLSEGHGLEDFRALFLAEGQDPTAVKLSLAALLRTDASSWLPLAEDLFADARGNPELRSAIAYAIATAAPVEMAAASLARLAGSGMYTEFSLLGMREGGSEALAARYSDLVASGGNPIARKMLVSGLRTESETILVGIARTDPDPSVRTQALLTSSLGRASGTELLDQLEALHGMRSDPAQGISTGNVLLVAGNVLINSEGPERERAKNLLLGIASDTSESDADRLAAARKLVPWMPAGTFDNWVIGGQNVK